MFNQFKCHTSSYRVYANRNWAESCAYLLRTQRHIQHYPVCIIECLRGCHVLWKIFFFDTQSILLWIICFRAYFRVNSIKTNRVCKLRFIVSLSFDFISHNPLLFIVALNITFSENMFVCIYMRCVRTFDEIHTFIHVSNGINSPWTS